MSNYKQQKLRQQLFNHIVDEHNVILLQTQIDDIFNICTGKVLQKVHIIKRGKKWAVKMETNKIATKVYQTKELAINDVYIKFPNRTIIIHDEHGQIERVIYT